MPFGQAETQGFANPGVVKAFQVIISSTKSGSGLFLYTGTAGPGNPPILSAVPVGVTTDPYGNTVNAVLNVGPLTGSHLGFDQNGIEYLSDSTATVRIMLDPNAKVIEFYDASGLGANHALITISPDAGTQSFTAFTFPAGVTVFAPGGVPFANLDSGVLSFQGTAAQSSPALVQTQGIAGLLDLESGQVNAGDTSAEFSLLSHVASGAAQSQALFNTDATIVNGTLSVSGTASINGASLTIGNGGTADVILNPPMAVPPNRPTAGKTLAQTQAFIDGMFNEMEGRGFFT